MASLKDLIKDKKQQIAAQSGRRQNTIKPKQGKNRYRVLPSWRGEDHQFWHDFGQHFIKSPAGKILSVYVCVDRTYGKSCAICDNISKGISSSTSDDMTGALKSSRASARALLNVIDRNDDQLSPQIIELTPTTLDQLFDIIDDEENYPSKEAYQAYQNGEEGCFNPLTDLDAGFDIQITREGTGLNTKYKVRESKKASSVDKSIMTKVHNLDDFVKQEYDAGLNKAIAAISSVSGALPSPTYKSSKDVQVSSSDEFEEDVPDEFEEDATVDLPEVSGDITDDELDAMLDDLD